MTYPHGGMKRHDMRILALEPYYGGSHKAFLDGWSALSRHDWTILTLPPYKWKWRMRHAAVTFAQEVHEHLSEKPAWDLLFCSDMLNLAEFRGLTRRDLGDLPSVVYFHENQLPNPVRVESERDYQFAMTNMTSALAADAVWFNSAFHRDSFLDGLDTFLKRMPDHQPTDAVDAIREKAHVHPPGVTTMPVRCGRKSGPLQILWAARWEHDKAPQDFFDALAILAKQGVAFRISVIGEQFREVPEIFARARKDFGDCIDRWGYQESRAQYEAALSEADVFVSTAQHEFFGLCAVEAALAGAVPLLPKRLAYPEVFGLEEADEAEQFFYDGCPETLAARLAELAGIVADGQSLIDRTELLRNRLRQFEWTNLVSVLDEAIACIAGF
jgi:glycosyltransferase involved in cell wall biosynthesis